MHAGHFKANLVLSVQKANWIVNEPYIYIYVGTYYSDNVGNEELHKRPTTTASHPLRAITAKCRNKIYIKTTHGFIGFLYTIFSVSFHFFFFFCNPIIS